MSIRTLLLISIICLLFLSCQEQNKRVAENEKESKSVTYAKGFDIEHKGDLSLIHLFLGEENKLSYVLYREDNEQKSASELGIPLKIPLSNFIALSSPYTAMMESLGASANIQAISQKEYIYSPRLIEKLEQGEVLEVGAEAQLNVETTLSLGADILLYSAFPGARSRKLEQLESLGLPCFPLSEWQELTLLGRAEWLKVIGALLDKQELADSLFSEIEAEYKQLLERLDGLEKSPLVISSLPFKGIWNVPGGNSYIAKVIKEAGGNYAWKDREESASIPLSFEAVYPHGLKADVWLSPGAVKSYAALLAQDERFEDFLPFQQKQIYHNYKRANPQGGNDYWESAVIKPHIILKDLIHIFHPQLLPAYQSVYFAPLEE